MFQRHLAFVMLIVTAVFCTACNHPIDPPGFRGVTLQSLQPDLARQSFILTLGIKYRYVNPLNVDLPVSAHAFSLTLDNQSAPVSTLQSAAFVVPAHGHRDIVYAFPLTISANGINGLNASLLGRDVPYQFRATFTLPIPQQLVPPQSFSLAFDDTIRLPKLPQVALDTTTPPRIQLLGNLQTVDISGIRDTLSVVGNALANLPVAGIVTALGVSASDAQKFKDNWSRLFALPSSVIDPATSSITGVSVEIPLVITNPNQFDITAPAASASLINASSGSAITSAGLSYASSPSAVPASTTIPANSTRKVSIVTTFSWNNLPATFTSANHLITALTTSGSHVDLQLKSDTTIDLGYGPVHIPFSAPITLHLGPP
jgi:hypothetical protein